MRKTFQYRLFTTGLQSNALDKQLGEACRLYNAALQERRDAWKQRVSISYYTQAKQLKDIRAADDVGLANFSCCQDILRRVDKTFKAFFLRVQRHQKAGYPRFKSPRRFASSTFPSYGDGVRLAGNRLRVQGVGEIAVKLHRPVAGTIKTVTVKRAYGKWYACFSVEGEAKLLAALDNAIGIDVGLASFATLSNGTKIPNPRWYRQAQARLRRAQRRAARRKKGSNRRRTAVALLQKVHARIWRLRNEYQHRQSFRLVRDLGTMVIEDLNIKGRSAGMLSKSVHDAGWASFIAKVTYKAENAGRQLIAVNPAGPSQTCICGASVRKALSDREHVCIECGLIAPRDVVSAQVILQRARISPSGVNEAEVIACVA